MESVEKASKSHDIQVALEGRDVPEFELIPKVGMMVNLSLHIRGLPLMEYEKLRLVSSHYFSVPTMVFKEIVQYLAEVEFVRLFTEGSTIKKVLPQVPFFDDIYQTVGEYAVTEHKFNEQEEIALTILSQLSNSPTEKSNIYGSGAETKVIDRTLKIGVDGGYILSKRARGKDILISPLFFSENVDLFTDMTAKAGATKIKRILNLIGKSQGWPLSIIEKTLNINGQEITKEDLLIIKRLAQDGAVKPPSITTGHAGKNLFLFTPAPGNSKLNPSNKEIYERAMALVSSVRQGQLLSKKYPILWPDKILRALKRDGWLKPTSETYAQYHQLAIMKVGRLEKTDGDRYKFVLNSSDENLRALDLAIKLVEDGKIGDMEVNQEAKIALQKDQTYIESIISSTELRKREKIELGEEAQAEFENLLIKGLPL
jgi:hypothetical protein